MESKYKPGDYLYNRHFDCVVKVVQILPSEDTIPGYATSIIHTAHRDFPSVGMRVWASEIDLVSLTELEELLYGE